MTTCSRRCVTVGGTLAGTRRRNRSSTARRRCRTRTLATSSWFSPVGSRPSSAERLNPPLITSTQPPSIVRSRTPTGASASATSSALNLTSESCRDRRAARGAAPTSCSAMAIRPIPLPIASYQLPDLRAGAKRLVNCFPVMPSQAPQPDDTKDQQQIITLRRWPGITTFANYIGGNGGVRGIWEMGGTVYVVIGSVFAQLSPGGIFTQLNTITPIPG